ncbi:MAG: aminopeptidase N [Deltaproteobacteria bacterium]|nr:aminopeptidase N [Deltaproteobacteria bacterium]
MFKPYTRGVIVILVALLGCSLFSSCSRPPLHERASKKGLMEEQARFRAQLIHNIRYDLSFSLDAEKGDFSGKAKAAFRLRSKEYPITLDFADGQIVSLTVNEKNVTPIPYNRLFLTLAPEFLKEGENRIIIEFTHPYSQTGAGLYRFKDPQDQRLYLYTDFEPFDANRLFPCFDQPDLKASYTVSVEAPSTWQVISSVREEEISPEQNGRKTWRFPKSSLFSTYLFPLHAGEYKTWESQADSIPLRLFARQSIAPYVEVEEWFKITRQGFTFYQTYFDIPYPFKKYDQLIVPDFNSGAMENIGAVTFSERYVERGKSTEKQREKKASVILHEMSHMWFGNLVTMRWWNDLWLNESFATYLATLAIEGATEFKNGWLSFLESYKHWGYYEDDLTTHHPVEVASPDTEQAFTYFDGITYGKGASLLKQLDFYLGSNKFREGVRKYLKENQYENTERESFLSALEASSGVSLKRWTEAWLTTEGISLLQASYRCEGGKIREFSLNQGYPFNRAPKPVHRLQIALFGLNQGVLNLQKVVTTLANSPKTPLSELQGESCPAFVFPNFGDHAYVKMQLDAQSLTTIKKHLSDLTDPLSRMMIWQLFWNLVREGEMPLFEFTSLLLEYLPQETEVRILSDLGSKIYGSQNRPLEANLLLYLPQAGEEGFKTTEAILKKLEEIAWLHLLSATAGSDHQKFWFDSYVRLALSSKAKENLKKILAEKIKLSGFTPDQDRRWAIVLELNAAGHAEQELLLEEELKRDPSEQGQKMALASRAARPTTSKREWLEKILSPDDSMTLARQRIVMEHLFPAQQKKLRGESASLFFEKLPTLIEKRDSLFMRSFVRSLVPAVCTEKSSQEISGFLQKSPELPPTVLKGLQEAYQENERCRTVQKRLLSTFSSLSGAKH